MLRHAMAMTVDKFRRLVALDPNDPLSRFALGKKLFEERASDATLTEAIEHLAFANERAPEHLATYHILGQALIAAGRADEAKIVLAKGIERCAAVGEGMGRDLLPAMQELLDRL
jgi:predicted Zn-dependent protease